MTRPAMGVNQMTWDDLAELDTWRDQVCNVCGRPGLTVRAEIEAGELHYCRPCLTAALD